MPRSVTRITGTMVLQPGRKSIDRAAQIICSGGLVAFPTETVYGLGAAVSCARAVARIFTVKGRPPDNPLIVHVANRNQVREVVSRIPDSAVELMERFWPGPLSLVLPRSDAVPPVVSAGLCTVAVRMPAHPVALQLIHKAGVPIAAPSANISGRPSPTVLRHVLEDFAGRIDAVLDGGRCTVGVESTVLDLTGPRPLILRPGGVTRGALEAVLGTPLAEARWKGETVPLSPGMKYRHYAPRAPLLLITGSPERRAGLINSLIEYFQKRGITVGLLNSFHREAAGTAGNETSMARGLYSALRGFDARGVGVILAEETSTRGIGSALMNRLRKAATRVIKT